MKKISRKRADLLRSVEPFRRALRIRVSRCEFCLKTANPHSLDVHELVPGYLRALALDKVYATLCVTRLCHQQIERLTIPNQMAYLLRSRPESFNIELYWKLMRRQWPSMEEILYFLAKISNG